MFSVEQAARAFWAARRDHRPLAAFPGSLPLTMADAYRVQDQLIRDADVPVAGWKIAGVRPEFRRAADASFLCGPIFRSTVFQSVPGGQTHVDVLRGGFTAVEAELVFQVRSAVEPCDYRQPDELAELIGAVHLGVEIAGNPLTGISDLGPMAVAAGFGNNLGLIVGPELAKSALAGLRLQARVNNELVGEVRLGGVDDRIPGFSALLEILGQRGIVLEEGAWISTGALTGVHSTAAGDSFGIELDGYPAILGSAL
jgi:2-keto-4-pentenoate hydratase